MSDQDFLAWHEYHVTIFALAQEDSDSVAAWRNALVDYPIDDLYTASAALLRTAPKSFRNDHVPGFFKLLPARPKRREPAKKFGSACPCEECQRRKAGEAQEHVATPRTFSFVREAIKQGEYVANPAAAVDHKTGVR